MFDQLSPFFVLGCDRISINRPKQAWRTWYGGAKACGMEDHQSVLQAASAHALSTNQNQCLSLEWWHLCHFFIDLQLMSVKLYLKDEAQLFANENGNQRSKVWKVFWPAFLAVRYIIFFFFFPAMVPQRIPTKQHGTFIQSVPLQPLSRRGQV